MSGPWPATHWSIVRKTAKAGAARSRRRAWQVLVGAYQPAMINYVRWKLRRIGGGIVLPDEAEDVVQAFLAMCVERDVLAKAVPDKGRFRSFVCTALWYFTKDVVNRRKRLRASPQTRDPLTGKRTARPVLGSEDLALAGRDDAPAVDAQALARDWSDCTLAGAIAAVRKRSARNAAWLDLLRSGRDPDDVTAAAHCGVRVDEMALLRLRARQMLAQELWKQVGHTVEGEEARTQEMHFLLPFLGDYLRRSQVAPLLEPGEA